MATYWIIVIIVCAVDLLLAFGAFSIADERGHDPMSAFIATMMFSLIGFGFTMMLSRRKQIRVDEFGNEVFKTTSVEYSNPKVDYLDKVVIIFYAKRTKQYHMKINDNPIGMDQFDEVFNTDGVRFYKEEKDFTLTEIPKAIAKNLLEWD